MSAMSIVLIVAWRKAVSATTGQNRQDECRAAVGATLIRITDKIRTNESRGIAYSPTTYLSTD
jgi:hypothetical protein